MDIDRVDHLVLTVGDLAATADLYGRVLGMRVVTDDSGRTALHFGEQMINLHPAGAEYVPYAARPTPGSGDVCFVVRPPMDEIVAHLAAHGVAVELGPVPRDGALGPMTSVYLRDPDGNLVELARYDAP